MCFWKLSLIVTKPYHNRSFSFMVAYTYKYKKNKILILWSIEIIYIARGKKLEIAFSGEVEEFLLQD